MDKNTKNITTKKTTKKVNNLKSKVSSVNIMNNMNDEINVEDLFRGNDIIIQKNKKENNFRDKNQTTWVDKYRPHRLEEIIGHDEVKKTLIESIKKGDLPHLLFYGGSGTGKTSTVLALVMQLYGPKMVHNKVLELNASDENGIGVVRDKIISFANMVVGSPDPKYPSPNFKIVILDEADSMTSEAQTALKKVMETTCNITRFIFICNYENKIISAIKSRCADFRFKPIPDSLMIEKLEYIAKQEQMDIDIDALKIITKICDGDARRSINTLQNIKYIPKDNIKITKNDIYDITSYIDKSYFDKYWNDILNSDVKNLVNMALNITNTGYPMNYLLKCLKDKVVSSNMSCTNISKLLIHISKIERMITDGSDNYIQLLSIFAHINSIFKNIDIVAPSIY